MAKKTINGALFLREEFDKTKFMMDDEKILRLSIEQLKKMNKHETDDIVNQYKMNKAQTNSIISNKDIYSLNPIQDIQIELSKIVADEKCISSIKERSPNDDLNNYKIKKCKYMVEKESKDLKQELLHKKFKGYIEATDRLAKNYNDDSNRIRSLFTLEDFKNNRFDSDEFYDDIEDSYIEMLKDDEYDDDDFSPEKPLSDRERYFKNFGTYEGY